MGNALQEGYAEQIGLLNRFQTRLAFTLKSLRLSTQQILKKALYYAGLILLADFAAFSLIALLLGRRVFHNFTLFTLSEAGLLFLIGGAVDIAGSSSFAIVMKKKKDGGEPRNIDEHKGAQSKAATFVVAGLFLLLVSFLLAYPLN